MSSLKDDVKWLNRKLTKAGFQLDLAIRTCDDIDRDRKRGHKLRVMHVERPGLICCASDTDRYPSATRRGLLAHEVGHQLLLKEGRTEHTEHEADLIVKEVLGIRIRYDKDGLQTL